MELFGTTGQERRAWLDGIDAQISEALRYYLGPTGIDKKVNALAQVAPMFMDGTDVVDAQAANDRFWASPSVPNALAMAAPMAALAVPGVSNRLAQGMADTGADLVDAGQRFVRDESGALRLYHGSPHDFDEFSLSKIGTGEGAQAYGHGLYFAEAEDTARAYRDDLSRPKNMWTQQAANGGLEVQYKTRDGRIGTAGVFDPAKGDVFDQAMSAPFGRMYEVEVNANPEDFLDWDRPLSEQPEIARKLGLRIRSEREINDEAYGLFDKYGTFDAMPADARSRLEYLNDEVNLPGTTQTGREIYEYGVGQQENVHDLLSGPDPYRADKLRELGIPGIRYLDAGSRGAGDGSRNYVVFDDKLISILRKYGMIPGAVGLGANALSYDENKREIRDYLGGM